MKAATVLLLLAHVVFAQQEPQQIDAPQLPDSTPIEGAYGGQSLPVEAAEAPIQAPQAGEPMPAQGQQDPLPIQASQAQDPDPSDPHPILKDLLSSVGVDNIGPDQPGGYGSGITAPSPGGAGEPRPGDENVVDQVLDQQKQQIQQHQAEKAANEDIPPPQQQGQAPEGAPLPQQQGQARQPGPGRSMTDPTNGLLNNNAINPAMPGPGSLPNANSAFGIPPIPPIADFTLPATPAPPSEVASSKDQANDSVPSQETPSPALPDDDSSRTAQAVIIASSVGGAVLFGILAGVGLMWLRHKRHHIGRMHSPV